MQTSPDPVAEPKAYQDFLLALLGSDDPLLAQSMTPSAWEDVMAEAGDGLRTRPEPGEWSVLECLGHATDAEVVYGGRYRWILAHDEPPLIGYDQDLWVERLRHNEDDPAMLLALFRALREANLELWRRTPDSERPRVGVHAERGPESYELSFQIVAGHDRFHLDQARRAIAVVAG